MPIIQFEASVKVYISLHYITLYTSFHNLSSS